MSSGLGGAGSSPAFAGAIVVYFAAIGFVAGWLAAYFLLAPAMSQIRRIASDEAAQGARLAKQADREMLRGNLEMADTLRQASTSHLAVARSLLAPSTPGPPPTPVHSDALPLAPLDRTVEEAASAHLALGPSAQAVRQAYAAGSRQREIALAVMAQDPTRADIAAIVSSIAHPASSFEQRQALRAAMALVNIGGLQPADAAAVREAIEQQTASGGALDGESDRRNVALEILGKLS
jgi:hypothetical protein